jgi:hypothetical protein
MNRIDRPFYTYMEHYTQDARVMVPSVYRYTSEGRTHLRLSDWSSIDVNISISRTVFKNADVVHFTIMPAAEGGLFGT